MPVVNNMKTEPAISWKILHYQRWHLNLRSHCTGKKLYICFSLLFLTFQVDEKYPNTGKMYMYSVHHKIEWDFWKYFVAEENLTRPKDDFLELPQWFVPDCSQLGRPDDCEHGSLT